MRDFSAVYATQQENFGKSGFSPADKETIAQFLNNLQARGVSFRRLLKYLEKFKGVKPFLKKDLVSLSGVEIDALLVAVNSSARWTAWTKHDYQLALKKFYRFIDGNDERAGRIKIITPLPELVDESTALTLEDVRKLEYYCRNEKDKAIIRILFDSGLRSSEFLGLKIGSVSDLGDCIKLKVSGTKNRYANRVVIIDELKSLEVLRNYLSNHPERHNPAAPLWLEPVHGKPLEARNLNELIRYRAKLAGITKDVNPHSFRKGSVTHYRRRGLTNASLETRFGWRKGSEMLAVYDRSGEQALLEDMRKTKPITLEDLQAATNEEVKLVIAKNPELVGELLDVLLKHGLGDWLLSLEPYVNKENLRTSENVSTPRAGLEPNSAVLKQKLNARLKSIKRSKQI